MQFESSEQLKEIFDLQGKRRWQIAKTTAKERIQKLKKLRAAIVMRQQEFYDAVWEDFHKSKFEAWLCEIFPTMEEIDCAIENLSNWMEDKGGDWVFFLPTTKSHSHFEPKGRVLIMAPWNYPFLLFVSPIVSAIAAGNVVMAKPSNKTPRVSNFLASLFEDIFDKSEVAVIEGSGSKVGDELLNLPFDHIFFTGSPKVGAHVGQMAAKVHAGLTLELGGKSPTVILPHVNLADAAKKITWGKTLNAGQTCIAPDYIFCPKSKVDEFANLVAEQVKQMFGETFEKRKASPDFVHIIDTAACTRHKALVEDALSKDAVSVLDQDTGNTEGLDENSVDQFDVENRYSPITILKGVTTDMSIMESEIFGPLMPILAYENLDEVTNYIQSNPKPLALYVFGSEESEIKKVLSETTSGSACVNNLIIQIENLSLPFGGVGMSGTGNYHGIYGFKTFSHERNVMMQGKFDVLPYFYAPFHYSEGTKSLRLKIQKLAEKALRLIKRM